MPTIELSEESYERLRDLAGQLFTIPEVIDRLVGTIRAGRPDSVTQQPAVNNPRSNASGSGLETVRLRAPRERGAVVEVAGRRIHGNTVRDLYEQVFKLLDNSYAEGLGKLVPYSTSSKRYLVARKPKHPNGNDFFVPLKVGHYYIEAHKNYDTALKQLDQLLRKLDLDLLYVS